MVQKEALLKALLYKFWSNSGTEDEKDLLAKCQSFSYKIDSLV